MVAIALGESATVDGINYTGRHWWGIVSDGESAVEPLRGEAADRLAAELGFPRMGSAETGTTVAVIAPRLDERSVEEAGEWLAEAMLWHLWPKMLELDGCDAQMQMSVSIDGRQLDVPEPATHGAIKVFAQALEEIETDPDNSELLMCGQPRQPVGRLSLKRSFSPRPRLSEVAVEAGLVEGVHHVCMMRRPRLVVEYVKGRAPLVEGLWYAGVFKALWTSSTMSSRRQSRQPTMRGTPPS